MKKLLLLISLFSVSCAFGMNPNASAGKAEADGDQPAAAARASASAPASAAATAPIDHAQTAEETVSLTFADSEDATRELKLKYANCAQTLIDFLSVFGGAAATPTIDLSFITAADFDLLAPYWEPVFQISIALDDDEKAEYTQQLTEQLSQVTDKAQLGTIITGADYLGIQSLVDCSLHVAHDQLVAEIDFNSFMDEEALQNYNPYNLNSNLNSQLAALLVEPAAHYLENQTTYMHTLTGHTGSITHCCFSPDGQTILTTSNDGTAKLWDLNGNCIVTLNGHAGPVTCGYFSPDGKRILTTANQFANWETKLWDLNGTQLLNLPSPSFAKSYFSPNGKLVLTIDNTDLSAKIWNLNGKCIKILRGHTNDIKNGRFSPNGKLILTVSYDNTAKIWNLDGECINTIFIKDSTWESCYGVFSPDNKKILIVHANGIRHIFDIQSDVKKFSIYSNKTNISGHEAGRFSPNGKTILTISRNTPAQLWDSCSGDLLLSLSEKIDNGCFDFTGNIILTVSEENIAKLWDLHGNCLQTLTGHTDRIFSKCFSPDGKTILTASLDRTAKLWQRYPQEAHQLKQNCTLARALLLRFALHKKGISACSQHSAAYQSIYQEFSPEMQTFIAPLIGINHCQQCAVNKRRLKSAAWVGAAAAGWLAYKAYQWYRK